jgi:hypothetical protein
MKVIFRDVLAILKLLFMIKWCDHVIEIPDEIRISVFSRGIFKGLNGLIYFGGQICPNSTFGDTLLWKNAQKKEKKNMISDVINNTIPIFNLFITIFLCSPWFVDSPDTLYHQM